MKEGEEGEGGGSDPGLSLQVQRLTQELRSLASFPRADLTVVQGGSGSGVSVTTFTFSVAVVGAVSYGCLKWRGYSFGDVMYVTRKGMSDAVASMGKQLEHVSAALSSTRKHMNQRLDTVNSKLDDTIVVTGLIKDQVEEVKGTVGRSIYEIENMSRNVEGLGWKIDEVKESQNVANQGILLLIKWVHHLNVVSPNQHPELAQSFKSWYLKASSLGKTSSFAGAITSPGLKQLFSEALQPQPLVNNLPEMTPVRNTGESRPPGLNLPSPGLSRNSSTGISRTVSASMISRSSLRGLSELTGNTGIF